MFPVTKHTYCNASTDVFRCNCSGTSSPPSPGNIGALGVFVPAVQPAVSVGQRAKPKANEAYLLCTRTRAPPPPIGAARCRWSGPAPHSTPSLSAYQNYSFQTNCPWPCRTGRRPDQRWAAPHNAAEEGQGSGFCFAVLLQSRRSRPTAPALRCSATSKRPRGVELRDHAPGFAPKSTYHEHTSTPARQVR